VTSGVAGLADAQAAAEAAFFTEAQQAIVDGAANAADVTVTVPYALEDTLANLEGAAEGVVEGAESYSLTETEFTAEAVTSGVAGLADAQAAAEAAFFTEAQQAIVDGAANAADVTVSVPYSLNDDADVLLAADADVLAGADVVTVNNETLTREQFDALNALENINLDLEGVNVENTAPEAVVATGEVAEDATFEGQLEATDPDVADQGDELTFALAEGQEEVAGFTLNADGSYSFDAAQEAFQALQAGDTQDVVINYTVTDSEGATSTNTLTLTVTGTDDAPVVAIADENLLLDDGAAAVFTTEDSIADVDGFGGGVTVTLSYETAIQNTASNGSLNLVAGATEFGLVKVSNTESLIVAKAGTNGFSEDTEIGTIKAVGVSSDGPNTQTGQVLDLNSDVDAGVLTALLKNLQVEKAVDNVNNTVQVTIESDGGAEAQTFTRKIEGSAAGQVELSGTETTLEAELSAGALNTEAADVPFAPFGAVDYFQDASGDKLIDGMQISLTSDNDADAFVLNSGKGFTIVSGRLIFDNTLVGTVEGLNTNALSITLDNSTDVLDESKVNTLLSNLFVDLEDATGGRSINLGVTSGDGLSSDSLTREITTLDGFSEFTINELVVADSTADPSTAVELSGNVILTVGSNETFNIADQLAASNITGTADLIRIQTAGTQTLAGVEGLDQLAADIKIDQVTTGTLTIDAAQADFLSTAGKVAGDIAVTGLEGNLDADLSGFEANAVTATLDTTAGDVTFTGTLGDAALTVSGGNVLSIAASIANGETISVDGTATLVITDLESGVDYDFGNITGAGTFQVLVEGDVTLGADADLNGADVRLAEGANLTGTAAQLTDLTITDDTNNATLTVTDLAETLNANLSGVAFDGEGNSVTAQWDNTGLKSDGTTEFTGEEVFAGDLGDVTVDVAQDAQFTTTAATINGVTVEGAGSVLVTDLGAAEVDLSTVAVTGSMTVQATDDLNDATDLGSFDVVAKNAALTLTAAQADARNVKAADSFNTATYTGLAATQSTTLKLTDADGNVIDVTVNTGAEETLTAAELAAPMASAIQGNAQANALVEVSVEEGVLTIQAKEAGTLKGVATTGDNNPTLAATQIGTVVIAGLDGEAAYDFSQLVAAERLGTDNFGAETATLTTAVGTVTLHADTNLGDVEVTVNDGETLTLSAAQANGNTIVSTAGNVEVTGFDAAEYDFSNVTSTKGDVTLQVAETLTVNAATDLSGVSKIDFGTPTEALTLTLSAAQADGILYVNQGEANVEVTETVGTEGVSVYGTANNDVLRGTNEGNDTFFGSEGADVYHLSGTEDTVNTIAYTDVAQTGLTSGTRDTIFGFQGAGLAGGDKIDLSALGDFTFVGTASFSGNNNGQVRYLQANGNTTIEIDTNGDGAADMQIRVDGLHQFDAQDFDLTSLAAVAVASAPAEGAYAIEDTPDNIRDASQEVIDKAVSVELNTPATVEYNVADATKVLNRLTNEADLTLTVKDSLANLLAVAKEESAAAKVALTASAVFANDIVAGEEKVTFTGADSAGAATAIDFLEDEVTLTLAELNSIIDSGNLATTAGDTITVDYNSGTLDATGEAADFVLNAGDDNGNWLDGVKGVEIINWIQNNNSLDDLTTADTLVASGETVTFNLVEKGGAADFTFDGSNETDGTFVINGAGINGVLDATGGAGADIITGGAGADIITGGAGADVLEGGADADTFVYAAGDSDFANGIDAITDLVLNDAAADLIQFDLIGTINQITSQTFGDLDSAFDLTAVNALINSTDGTGTRLSGDDTNSEFTVLTTTDAVPSKYLVIDTDGNGVIENGTDFVVDVTGVTETSVTAANFIDVA